MKQWEYKLVRFTGDPGSEKEQEMLSDQGQDGWELCAIYVGILVYYFKRQVIETEQQNKP